MVLTFSFTPFSFKERFGNATTLFASIRRDVSIDSRYNVHGQQGRNQHSAYYGHTHRDTLVTSLTTGKGQRYQTQNGGGAGHQNRT